jgi:ketosteroid isomerase-like protein
MKNALLLYIPLLVAAARPGVAVAQSAQPAKPAQAPKAAAPKATAPSAAATHGAKIVDDAFVKAFRANDLAAVVALYAPAAKFYPPFDMERTGAAIRENFAAFLGSNTVKDFKVLDATYETSGTLSVGWGRFSMTVVPKKEAAPMTMEGRFTSVAKKIGGKWLYVSDHASFVPPPAAPAVPQFPKPASMPAK